MILHTVNKSPLKHHSLHSCLQFLGAADAILLLEDGVYGGLRNVDFGLEQANCPVYAISADVLARGLESRLVEGIKLVDYAGFVELCTHYDVVKNWS